ncbi:MAG: integrase family protein [Methyloceanibacter sp.]
MLPAKRKQYLIWDSGTEAARGLAILVSPTGTKSYRCVFYFPGSVKPNWKHLGRVGEMTLEEAREETRKARRMAKEGEDPKAADAAESDTFEAVLDAYTREKINSDDGSKSAERSTKVIKSACAKWLHKPIGLIRTDQIKTLLRTVRDGDGDKRPAPYMANRLHAQVGGLFRWATEEKLLTANPMLGLKKPWNGAKAREFSWFEGDDADAAVKAVWYATDRLSHDEARYVKFALLTGKRHEQQIRKMRWEQIDGDWIWHPKGGSKHKRAHPVPLSSLAQRVLGLRQESGPVFGHVRSKMQEAMRKLLAETPPFSENEPFIMHGCKHIMETGLAKLRVPPHLRDLLLDHKTKRGTGGDYDKHDYETEMREAVEAWADHVASVVQPEGVAVLR